jgi:hypothetical protein
VTLGAFLLVLIGLAVSGRFGLWLSPDTPSYLAAAAAADPLAQLRIPLYGWLVGGLIASPAAWLLPWLQAAAFLAAVAWLLRALRNVGVSRAGRLAVGLALAGANIFLLWANAALPELPGHAALLAGFAATIDIAAGRRPGWRLLAVAAVMALGWAFRPAMLPFLLLLPILPLALPRHLPMRRLQAAVLGLLAACLLPFLAFSGLRAARYGDFNVVSFGGFQMSGMAALMLTPDIAARLPPDMQDSARRIIAGRDALVAAGEAMPIPRNSTGQRSFPSAAFGYFDILVRTHDAVLYSAVAPLRGANESWVAFNARMQSLALATIRAAPIDYAAWLAGATARLVGHAIVLNPMFLVALAALILACLHPASRTLPPSEVRRDVAVLAAITGLYTLGASVLIVLATIPAQRYIDSAMLFLPVWPLYGAIRLAGLFARDE